MHPRTVFAVLTACAGAICQGQTGSSLEVCGIQFHLGMTRDEVKQKATFPEGTWNDEAREKWLGLWFGGDTVALMPMSLGLEKTAKCSGALIFKKDRVVEIDKDLASTTDAFRLVRNLYFEIERAMQAKGPLAVVKTATRKVGDTDFVRQLIWFGFGDHFVMVSADEAEISGETSKGGTIAIGMAQPGLW